MGWSGVLWKRFAQSHIDLSFSFYDLCGTMLWKEVFSLPPLCVSWAHISNNCRKKLDVKSHAFIMMGYSEELKAYPMFDNVKWKIIIIWNVWFDEKYYGIKLLNASSILLQDDPFDVFSETGSPTPYFSPSTR